MILAVRLLKLGDIYFCVWLKLSIKTNKLLTSLPYQQLPHFFPLLCSKLLQRVVFNLSLLILSSTYSTLAFIFPHHHQHTTACQVYHDLHITKSTGQFCLWHSWSFPSPGYSFFTWFPGHHPLLLCFVLFSYHASSLFLLPLKCWNVPELFLAS